ncbi:MAG: hypothetical protein GY861_03670 [bacterium]|nr:hypothetical protein [bacterium]
MKIEGTVKEIVRVIKACPVDGVHRLSQKDGKKQMKGCRSVILNGKTLMPRGMSGFYLRYKDKYGVKVFYSMGNNVCSKMKTLKKQFKKQNKLYKLGVATQPHKIVTVKLDFKYYGKDGKYVRHVKKTALGIKVTHINYPEKAWKRYAKGHPYDWKADSHKDHCPKGYLRFCKKMKKILLKNKIYVCGGWPVKEKQNPKLGDIVFDTKKKRYYLVDVGD